MKNIGIILAGGSGQRMGGGVPKQFFLLSGKTILEYTLTAFQRNSSIDEMIIVTHADYLERTRELAGSTHFSKVSHILPGGRERYCSTLAALEACPGEECRLIIHDAVRPLVSQQMINDCISALETYQACTTAMPATDTILMSDEGGNFVHDIPARKYLFQVQTPQAFRKSVLTRAYQLAAKDASFFPTDDCGAISRYLPEIKIKLVKGSPANLKITYPEDLITAEKLLCDIQ